MMMTMTMIKVKEQRRREGCGRLHVALNHVTCVHSGNRKELKQLTSAQVVVLVQPCRLQNKTCTARVVRRNHGNKQQGRLRVVLRCVCYVTNFCPLCTLAN
jgi:hypothetical protein